MNFADIECWRSGLEEIIDRDQQKIIVLDNLQILLCNKTHLQSELIYAVLRVAKSKKVHIIVVVHPNSSAIETQPINNSNLFGGSTVTQLASNVLILRKIPKGIDRGLFVYDEETLDNDCNHYAVLGVYRDSHLKTIKRAFMELGRVHHPDKNNGVTTEMMQKLIDAWNVLGDKDQKEDYDRILQERMAEQKKANI